MTNHPEVRASDLVGCRYRLRQRAAHPDAPPLPDAVSRQPQIDAARAIVLDALPVKRAVGDGRRKLFRRVDLDPALAPEQAFAETRAAMRAGTNLITNATLAGEIEGYRVVVDVDILVRTDAGYAPVVISNHRVARPHPEAELEMVAVNRLGLSEPLKVHAKARHHTADGYRLGLAELLLQTEGLDTGSGGVIGQDRTRAYVADVTRFIPPLIDALNAPIPDEPKRLKQCATCRFWVLCQPRLEELDDISLVFPGGRGDAFREQGIETVQQLIDAHLGDPSHIAQAWRDGVAVLRRPGEIDIPRADVEIDVDMEAYLSLIHI